MHTLKKEKYWGTQRFVISFVTEVFQIVDIFSNLRTFYHDILQGRGPAVLYQVLNNKYGLLVEHLHMFINANTVCKSIDKSVSYLHFPPGLLLFFSYFMTTIFIANPKQWKMNTSLVLAHFGCGCSVFVSPQTQPLSFLYLDSSWLVKQ